MRNFNGRKVLVGFILLCTLLIAAAHRADGRTLYGVSRNNQLVVSIDGVTTVIGTIPGTQGEPLLGLDFRPATGQLYALGNTGRLYTINRFTAAARFLGQLSVRLGGNKLGFTFDPMTDRIRVVTNSGQNLSINPNNLVVTIQTPLNPGAPQAIAAAYTNGYKGATSTTFYVFNRINNSINTITPPSSGTVVEVPGSIHNGVNPDSLDIDSVDGAAYSAYYTGVGEHPGAITTFDLRMGTLGGLTFLPGTLVLYNLTVMREPATAVKADFDGDKFTDYSVFRPSNNYWFANLSSNNNLFAERFGLAGDVLTPGDYDGDEKTDVAVWRPATGVFYVLRSSSGTVQSFPFGQNGDEPVPQDFDGDGRTDFAVVRRSSGVSTWYIINSSNGTFRAEQWGLDTDTVVSGDYDGDGRFDLAVRRGTGAQQAVFHILRSTAGYLATQWGLGSDSIVPGDYDVDGKTDLAVVRSGSSFKWYILNSSNGSLAFYNFGASTQLLAPGDYDADGRTDPTVFEASSGTFYVLRSTDGTISTRAFGLAGDVPVAAYDTK